MNNNTNNDSNNINNNLYTSSNKPQTNNIYIQGNINNQPNSDDKPYIILSDKELKNKKVKNKIFYHLFYVVAAIVLVFTFYLYRIDKYEFYLTKSEILLNNGSSYQIELIPKNSMYFDYNNYEFKVVNNQIATIDKYGLVTALSNGTTNVQVKYKNGIDYKTLKLNVDNVNIKSITFDNNIDMSVNETVKATPIFNNDDSISSNVSYKSDNDDIVVIDDYGNINATGVGETTIRAIAENGVTGELFISIKPSDKEIQEIKFVDNNVSILKNNLTNLSVIITPTDATNQTLIWEASNDNVKVDGSGRIYAANVGTTTIKVTTNNGKTAECIVNVTEENIDPTNITLNASSKEMTVGEKINLISTITPENATNRNITWESSNTSIATVDNSGLVSALKEGNVTITAKTSNGKQTNCLINVKKNDIKSTAINLNMKNPTVAVGNTITLNDLSNNAVTWESSDSEIASVNNGLVTTYKEGSVVITATTLDKEQTAISNVIVRNSNTTSKSNKKYTATFIANGAIISNTSASCETNTNACSIKSPSITRDGYKIDGWNTNSNSSSANYPSNSDILLNSNITYYAITHKEVSVKFLSNATTIENNLATCNIYNGNSSCQVTSPSYTASHYEKYGFSTNINDTNGTISENQTISVSNDTTYYAITKIKDDGVIVGCTGYMAIKDKLYTKAKTSASSSNISAGTAFTILGETGDFFYISTGSKTGYVLHKYVMVNLSDYIPSIIYDITNAYKSIYVSSGKSLPNVTGKKLYTAGKVYNNRLKREEFIAPAMYSFAKKILKGQKAALADGYTLKIYDSYRPHSVTKKIADSLDDLYKDNKTVKKNIDKDSNGNSWGTSWFLSQNVSKHNTASAIDVTLANSSTKEEVKMPTAMHELSTKAIKYKTSSAKHLTSNYSSIMKNSEPAKRLDKYMTDAKLQTLASEWWHFQEDSSYERIKDKASNGCNFQPTKVLSF